MYEFSPQLTGERARSQFRDLLDEAEQERQLQALKPRLRQRLVSGLYALAGKLESQGQQAPTQVAG